MNKKTMTNQKYLYTLKNGEKFIHENEVYTVYEQSANMTEVFKKNKFWAWPNYNGKESVKVTLFNLNI